MLNTKFNLYNPDWIELVFTDRNKTYGAYELRQHYGSTMLKAMGLAFSGVLIAAMAYSFTRPKIVHDLSPKIVDSGTIVVLPPLKPDEPKPAQPEPAQPKVATTAIPTKVTNDPVTTDPPVIDNIEGQIGPTTDKGDTKAVPAIDPIPVENSGGGSGGVVPTVDDGTIHDFKGLEVLPEPVGGAAAWTKFLSRNLRFPSEAQDAGKGGRVIVSFVVEKDGSLSSVTVEKGAGYGMDEEALRVLKLAKPWKPGVQNGRPVRVKYVIPLNFQLSE